MSKINGSTIEDINKSEKKPNSFNNQPQSEDNYKMNKSFNISNYNLDLIKCLQDDSGIYFILDPTKSMNEKKQSEVYDIFIPENSDGVTLHVQKVDNEYKCIGVSITKKGIDINTGTRIFNTKIADWLEQLFHFNKTLACNNSTTNNSNKLKRVGSNNSIMSNTNNNSTSNKNTTTSTTNTIDNNNNNNNNNNTTITNTNNTNTNTTTTTNNNNNNTATTNNSNNNNTNNNTNNNNSNTTNNNTTNSNNNSNTASNNDNNNNNNNDNSNDNNNNSNISNGNNLVNNKFNNFNNTKYASSGVQQSSVPNLIKNTKTNYDHFQNNKNYDSTICNKKVNKNGSQQNCNLNHSNGSNSIVSHAVASANLSSSQSKEQTHQHIQQLQHSKQVRLHQMNNPHSHKPHLPSYHNVNYDDKNSKLYNNANSNNLNNKTVTNGNSATQQVSSTTQNNEIIKNSKLGCSNRQQNINHHMHNHVHNDIFNSQNSHQNNHPYNHKSQQHSYNENYGYRPTLFNLLEVLANHNITTPDQRVCIRGIVTDFLNNELPHGKIYAYIGAVVGHDILHDIIRKLEKDPNRNVVPDASGLARIEAAFGLSKSSYDFMNNHSNNSSSVNNISNVLFNHRNLSSNILNNHIYSSILSNVASNNINNAHALNNDRLNIENEKLLNSKASNDINNLLKYAKSDKYSNVTCNNILNLNKKNNQNINNMLNLRCDTVFNNKNNNNFSPHDYICATRNLNMRCSNKNNFSDDEEELMKAIKKNIETYKMNNIKNILISSVFDRIKWLKIMNESPHAYLYGHSIVNFGNKLYMFGGSNNKNKKVPFNHTLTFSLIYYNYKLLPLGGNYPEERDGHTTHLISLKTGLSIFLFGGSNENIYYNDIYILDMETRKWSMRSVKGKLPLPRDQHTSLVYPAKSEHLRGEKSNLTEGVIIFGGKCLYNNNIVNLNDMWIFLFQSNMWVRINYLSEENPIGRHGMSLVWSDTNTLCLFGGEYYGNSKNFKERKLLDDMWIFKLHTNKDFASSSGNLRDGSYNPNDIIQTDIYNNQSSKNACYHKNTNNTTSSTEKNTYENSHSTSPLCNNNPNAYVSDKESSGNEKDKRFAKKIRITGEWQREVYEGKIGCRSNYSSIFITQRHQDFKGAEPKTIERLMLLCSGITYITKDNKKKIVSSDEIYVYFFSQKRWYLLRGKLHNEEFAYNGRQRHVGCFFESKNVLGRANKNPIPCIFIQGGFKKNVVFGDAWLLSLTGENPLRAHEYDSSREKISNAQVPLYYFRDTHSISLLYSFCTLQKWLFGAFANLVDNCIQSANPAENVFIKYELTPEHDGMLSIQDDGEGLDFNAMNKILRMYGSYKNDDKNLLYNDNNSSNVKKHGLPNNDFLNNKVDEFNDDQSVKNFGSNKNANRNSTGVKGSSHEYNKDSSLDDNGESSHKQKQKNLDNERTKEKQQNINEEEEKEDEEMDKENEAHNKKKKKEQENQTGYKKENDETDAINANNKEGGAYTNEKDNNPEDTTNEINKGNNNNIDEEHGYKGDDENLIYNENANNTFDLKYGIGFKMAFARISSSCAIMSRTVNTIGIGLLSLELMNHCDAKELATPLCMWKLPNKELINRNIANKSEHRHHQKLLMSYTPFNSPSLLAEQINILGTYSGTRLLYWDFRDDMDFIIFCPANNNIYLSSSPLSLEEIKYGKKKKNANNNNKHYCVEDVKLSNRDIKRKGNFEEEKTKKIKTEKDSFAANNNDCKNSFVKNEKEGSCVNEETVKKDNDINGHCAKNENNNNQDDSNNENNANVYKNNKNNVKKEKKINANTYDEKNIEKKNNNATKKDSKSSVNNKTKDNKYDEFQNYGNSLKNLNLFEYNVHLHPSISKEKYSISSIFPLWDHPKDSIDYCLSTYLYWLYLRRKTNIFLQNTLLIPTCMRSEDKSSINKKSKKFNKKKNKKLKKEKKSYTNGDGNNDFNKKIKKGKKKKKKEETINKENSNQHPIKEEFSEENKNSENFEPNENVNKINIPVKGEAEEACKNNENKNDDIEKTDDKIDKKKKQKTTEVGYNDIQNDEKKENEDKLEDALENGVKQEKKENEIDKKEIDAEDGEDIKEDEDEDEEDDDEDDDDDDNDDENEDDDEDDENEDEDEDDENEDEEADEEEKGDNDHEADEENEKDNENNEEKKIKKTKDNNNDNEIKENEKRIKGKHDKNENYVNNKKGNAHNHDTKSGDIEKIKKENYVNLYMENLKIKDEYYINNPSKYTLYSFLKKRLYKQIEFHYLFTPSDYEYGSFIMMGFLNDNDNTSIEVKRVCEAGILLYYKNRLIKRLDAPFIDTAYNLSLSKYAPNPSLYEGNLYKYALTVIVNVPNWLKPSISKQEFIHENNYVFLVFKKKIISLVKHYLLICQDNLKLKKWKESRDLKLKNYLEKIQYKLSKSKNESENEYEKAYKIVYNDKVRKEDAEKEEELEREENRQIVKEIEKAQEEKRKRENEISNSKHKDNYNSNLEKEEEEDEEDENDEYTKSGRKGGQKKKENDEDDTKQKGKGYNEQGEEAEEEKENNEQEKEEEDEEQEQEDEDEEQDNEREDEEKERSKKREKQKCHNKNEADEEDDEEEEGEEEDDDESEQDDEHGDDDNEQEEDGDEQDEDESEQECEQGKQNDQEEQNNSEEENDHIDGNNEEKNERIKIEEGQRKSYSKNRKNNVKEKNSVYKKENNAKDEVGGRGIGSNHQIKHEEVRGNEMDEKEKDRGASSTKTKNRSKKREERDRNIEIEMLGKRKKIDEEEEKGEVDVENDDKKKNKEKYKEYDDISEEGKKENNYGINEST